MLKKEQLDSDSHDLALRIKEALGALPRGGKARLAKRCNITSQAITGWVQTGRVDKKNLVLLAEESGYSLYWIMTGQGNKIEQTTADSHLKKGVANASRLIRDTANEHVAQDLDGLALTQPYDESDPLDENEIAIPLLREVELAGGSGCYEVIENHGQHLRFSRNMLIGMGVGLSSCACAKVRGGSMAPVYPNGCVVMVDTSETRLKDGETYAISHHGKLRIKQLYRTADGGIRIASINKAEWPDEIIPPNSLEQITILGWICAAIVTHKKPSFDE